MKIRKAIKRFAKITRVSGSRQKERKDVDTAKNQVSPSNGNRKRNQRQVSANTTTSNADRFDAKESKIYRSKQDQQRIERNQNGGTERKRNHPEYNRSDAKEHGVNDRKKKSVHRSLLNRIISQRQPKKAIPRRGPRQRDDEKGDKEARGKHKDFVSSQVELTQKLFQQKSRTQIDDMCHGKMEGENLQSSGSSFDADWSYKVDSSATNRGKNPSLNSDIDNTNTQRSQSKGSQPTHTFNKSPRGNTHRRKSDQDDSRDRRRQPSKIKSSGKKSRGLRKNELDSTMRELFRLIGKTPKHLPKVNGPRRNNRNSSSRNHRERRRSHEKQTRSRSLKRNDRTATRSKSKNPRSKSLPPSQQVKRNNRKNESLPLDSKSPRRTLPIDKSPGKRTRPAPTKLNTDPSLPLKNHCDHRARKNQPIEEPSETSQTDRTSRTEYTTSSAGPMEQTSRNHRARSRSKSRRSASRPRSSSRRPQTNRARSTSRKPRSTNSKMSVEDAKKLLHPVNHPTYVIQPVIDSSSEDEDDERERRTQSRSPRRRRSQKRDTSKDRGFSGLGVQQSKPRKGKRPKRPSEESKTERESPPSSPVITLSTRSSRRIQRSHSRERQRKEKYMSPEVIKIEGTKRFSDPMNKYPNPFVKT